MRYERPYMGERCTRHESTGIALQEVGLVRPSRLRAGPGRSAAKEVATKPVTISLNDCLACSGCVTSAETVLLQAQSVEALTSRLQDRAGPTVVVSLSPQSICSLAVAVGVPAPLLERRLAAALRGLGAASVLSTSPARDVVLAAVAAEAVDSWRSGATRPLLSSACPGWICYAEKTHGAWILPHLSAVRSPQALTAALVKGRWAAERGLARSDVFHCTVMPCFDKKLEASRDDFASDGVPDTDCVLATTEVAELMAQAGIDLAAPVAGEEGCLDTCFATGGQQAPDGAPLRAGWTGARLAGSGSYMEAVLRTVADLVPGARALPADEFATIPGRNPGAKTLGLIFVRYSA